MRSARNGLLTLAAIVGFAFGQVTAAFAEVDYPGKDADEAATVAAKEKEKAAAPAIPIIQYVIGGAPVSTPVSSTPGEAAGHEFDHRALDHVMERAANWRDSTPSSHPNAFPAK